jgi:tetratricopeptide (TPR) repeat protein
VIQAIYERRFDDGIALTTKQVSEIKPGEPPNTSAKIAMVQLGYLQELAGRPNESRIAFTRAIEAIKPTLNSIVPADSVRLTDFLAKAYAGLGEKDQALTQARRAVQQYNSDAIAKPRAEAALAQIQARFGDLDSALAALPHLLEVPAGLNPADLRYDPLWDPLRKDPRFQKLVEEKP